VVHGILVAAFVRLIGRQFSNAWATSALIMRR
jgi:hypothetical protein